jgi:hypothetical protein
MKYRGVEAREIIGVKIHQITCETNYSLKRKI